LLSQLLRKQPPEKFNSRELSRKAHWRWDRDQFLAAAVLFQAAAQRSAEEFALAGSVRDKSFSYRIRAGVNFRLAGEIVQAWPILLEATTFDWQAAGTSNDEHLTEWAFLEMLIVFAAEGRREEFARTFWQAVARVDELGSFFPKIHPKQELLLDLCEQLKLHSELAHVIESIEGRGKLPRRLAARLAVLRASLEVT
jgi:hypothetical protein